VLWQGCQELDRDSHKSSFECSCQVVGSGARVAPMRLLKDVNERTEDGDGSAARSLFQASCFLSSRPAPRCGVDAIARDVVRYSESRCAVREPLMSHE